MAVGFSFMAGPLLASVLITDYRCDSHPALKPATDGAGQPKRHRVRFGGSLEGGSNPTDRIPIPLVFQTRPLAFGGDHLALIAHHPLAAITQFIERWLDLLHDARGAAAIHGGDNTA
eukprot:scaffold4433_cov35-Tisochrysis_lutea.AAC.4